MKKKRFFVYCYSDKTNPATVPAKIAGSVDEIEEAHKLKKNAEAAWPLVCIYDADDHFIE